MAKKDTVLITGAAGLIGSNQVKFLVEMGYHVTAIDLDVSKLTQLNKIVSGMGSSELETCVLDITQTEMVTEKFGQISKNFNIVGLVNNAAINPKVEDGIPLRSTIFELRWPDWEREIKVGVYGAFNCSMAAARYMLEHQKASSIINISSDYGHLAPKQALYDDGSDNPPVKPPIYSVVKFGVVGLTKYLASFWARSNIRVNALAPGGVANGQDQQFIENLSSEVPMGRMMGVNELSGALEFLLSPKSSYVNGIELVVDGGRQIW